MMKKRGLLFLLVLFWIFKGGLPVFAWPVPDTEQQYCYDGIGIPINCENTGQDGEFLINPTAYTKLDEFGNELLPSAANWAMVRDDLTGLIWESKKNTDDSEDYNNPNDGDNTYTWYEPNSELNGGFSGTPGSGTDTNDFIEQLNNSAYGGFTDWRLPSRNELLSLVVYGSLEPSANSTFFDGIPWWVEDSPGYWTMDTEKNSTGRAWMVFFDVGSISTRSKSDRFFARAVRGKNLGDLNRLILNPDNTVTDIQTGLMWSRTSSGPLSWMEGLTTCSSWSENGYTDWRMPNQKELATIVDLGKTDPATNTAIFPDTVSENYWSSSFDPQYPAYKFGMSFSSGGEVYDSTGAANYVRPVRGGQFYYENSLYVNFPQPGSQVVAGCSTEIEWDAQSISGNVEILLSIDGGLNFSSIVAGTPNDGQHSWTVPASPSVNCVLKIVPLSDPGKDTSVGLFSIVQPDGDFPEILSIVPNGPNPTNASAFSFTATFSEAVFGVSSDHFSLATNGEITGAMITGFSGAGDTYAIQVGGISGDGTVRVNFGADCSVKDGDGFPVTNGFSGMPVTIDNTGPSAPLVSGPAFHRDSTPTWNWLSNGGGNGIFRRKLNNAHLNTGAIVTTSPSFTPIGSLSEGRHTLYVQERDEAGNWSTSGSFAITIDQGPPCSGVTSAPAEISGGPITLEYGAQDRFSGGSCGGSESGVGLSSVALHVKGPGMAEFVPAFGIEDRIGNFDGRLSFYPTISGVYEFYTLATDQAGNVESAPGVADAATTFQPAADGRVWAEPSSLVMAEGSAQGARVTVKPSRTPSAPVTVSLSLSNTGRCVLDKTMVTINGQAGAALQISPLDNEAVDGEPLVYVHFGPTVSADPDFNGLTIPPVAVFLTDDDVGVLQVNSIQPSLGTDLEDLTVTITGNGFSGGTAVYLSGNGVSNLACEVLSVSDREMIVRLPKQNAGDYDLRFVNPGMEVRNSNAVSFIAVLDYGKLRAKRAVLVAGGGPYEGNAFWDDAAGAVSAAYNALVHQGYRDDRIQLLSPVPLDMDGDGNSEVDDVLTQAALQNAVTKWPLSDGAPADGDLLFYFVGHGGTEAVELAEGDHLSIQTLKGWFDTLQSSQQWRQSDLNRIVAVFESCYSGAFLAALNPPPAGTERIVIASAAEDEDAWATNGGLESFSGFFWKGIRYEGELFQSFLQADGAIRSTSSKVDHNNDGGHDIFALSNVEAGNPAKVFIGLGKSSASNPPEISGVAPLSIQSVCDAPVTLRASGVTALNGVLGVYARILEPGQFEESSGVPKGDDDGYQVSLFREASGDYVGQTPGFTKNGAHLVWVYAVDKRNDISPEPREALIEVHSCVEVLPGNIDGVNDVNLQDAIVGLQVLAARTDAGVRPDFATCGADVGGDGRVGLADVIFVLRKVAGH